MESSNQPIWDRGARLRLSPLDRDVEADVCVIGLGGSGLSCVRELLTFGKRVVGLDARAVGSGASGRNGGFLLGGLAMFYHDAVARLGRSAARRLYESTLAEIDRIALETPDAVRRTGTLRVAASDEESEDCARQLEAMCADDLPVERYAGLEGTGLLFPADASFDPAARCRSLAMDAITHGARLFERTVVTAIENGQVTTPAGTIRARHVVVAVDGRLEEILPELSPRVRTARLQMMATAPVPQMVYPRPVYTRWGLDYWQQLPDGCVALGGCRDVGGDDEWTASDEPTDAVQLALTALLRNRLKIDAAVTHRWAASVGYTQTGLPIVEQVRPNVWAVGAYPGTGNVIGALAGRAVAQLIEFARSDIADVLRTP